MIEAPPPEIDSIPKKLNRFTTLPFLFDYLETRRLFLPNPLRWEDKNDSEVLRTYAEERNLKKLNALCFTSGSETIHHWKAFSWGAGGCCIQFSFDAVREQVLKNPAFTLRPITYKVISELRNAPPSLEDYPFLKRKLFSVEHEYRLISESTDDTAPDYLVLDLSAIQRITLSFDLPDSTLESLKAQISRAYSIPRSKISRSTLLKNRDWISVFQGQSRKP